MVLPFFVLADNPVSPAELDSSETAKMPSETQVETRSVGVDLSLIHI